MKEKLYVLLENKQTLNLKDFSTNEKYLLNKHLEKYDIKNASGGFSYLRLYKKGFMAWEIEGIAKIKKDFLDENKDWIKKHTGSLYPEGICETINGEFYKYISSIRCLRTKLNSKMLSLGMLSKITVQNRFSKDNWKKYEIVGIRNIINDMDDSDGCEV